MDLVDCPTVFHVPINGRVARRKRVSRAGARDRVSIRSRGMSRAWTRDCTRGWAFPGSRGVLRMVEAHDLSPDIFSGSRVTLASTCA